MENQTQQTKPTIETNISGVPPKYRWIKVVKIIALIWVILYVLLVVYNLIANLITYDLFFSNNIYIIKPVPFAVIDIVFLVIFVFFIRKNIVRNRKIIIGVLFSLIIAVPIVDIFTTPFPFGYQFQPSHCSKDVTDPFFGFSDADAVNIQKSNKYYLYEGCIFYSPGGHNVPIFSDYGDRVIKMTEADPKTFMVSSTDSAQDKNKYIF